MELVDILLPPDFHKTGQVKTKTQAYQDGDWLGTFNLWIIQNDTQPAVVYQVRSPNSTWAPNKLDVTAGGHYQAGESIKDGLREVKEELGKVYPFNSLTPIGQKIYFGVDEKGNQKHNLVDIFFIQDNSPLTEYTQETSEVYALCICPITDLIKVHTQPGYHFIVEALTHQGITIKLNIIKDLFPANWDNYHYKIALLSQRFLNGEKNLIY